MQPPSSAQALQSLTDFNTNRKSAQDVNTQAQAQYGIPESSARLSTIRGLVGNLQSSVNAVDPSVTGRTSGSFVTEGQRQALVNKERTPILGQLGEQQTALGNEQQNFNTSSSLASNLASSILSQDQSKYQGLLDQYNAATAAEQEAEKKREFDASLAEQVAARKAAASAGGAGSYDLGGGDTGATGLGNGAGYRVPGDASKGFGFVDQAGNTLNALQYSQGHQIPFRTLLQQMAAKGDPGAKAGLTFIGNDGNADPTKITSQALADLYHSLTGRWVGVYKPAPSGPVSNVPSSKSIPAFNNSINSIYGLPIRR